MTNSLRVSPSVLLAAVILLIQARSIFCWIPRLVTCRGGHTSTNGRSADRRKVSLAVSNAHEDEHLLDDGSETPEDPDSLFPEGDRLADYVSRLEAIMESDFFPDDTRGNSAQPLEEGGRVVLGDRMEWEESTCIGEFCWDEEFDQCDIPEEYKLAAPTVDVMSFLGIVRAEPLQIKYARDWD
jgi:hypothetical protein